jgi:hypothetical protein
MQWFCQLASSVPQKIHTGPVCTGLMWPSDISTIPLPANFYIGMMLHTG